MLLSSHYGESHRECASQARIRGSHLRAVPAAKRAEKRQILDEFCHVAAYHRKSAIRLLSGPRRGRCGPRGMGAPLHRRGH
jgi:hypothetical protein